MSGAAAVITALPKGYDTLLSKEFEGGVELSGGQWQKLAIARAYFRDALAGCSGSTPRRLLCGSQRLHADLDPGSLAAAGRYGTELVGGQVSTASVLLWLGALFLASLAESLLDTARRWVGEDLRERLKVRAQERLLQKATTLPLASFEAPNRLDQLHRAQSGLDRQLLQTMDNLLSIPTYLVTATALLVYVASAHWVFPVMLLAGMALVYLIYGTYWITLTFPMSPQGAPRYCL